MGNENNNNGKRKSRLPEESWSEDKKYRFINPYNFVPLEGSCNRRSIIDRMEGDKITGIISCKMEIKTPVIIPDSANKTINSSGVAEYKFFTHDSETPIIPGSELRGMLRSVHEAAFNGCLSSFDETRKLHRRSVRPKKAGILFKEEEKWLLRDCQQNKVKDRKWTKSLPEGEHCQGGYLHKGEFFGEVEPQHFIFKPRSKRFHVTEKEIGKLKRLLEQYADLKINKILSPNGKHTGYKEYSELLEIVLKNDIENPKVIPVYYSEYDDGTVGDLSPAAMSKEVFDREIGDMLPYEKTHKACDHKNFVCPSCALFGMISSHTGGSMASRIRVGDASPRKDTQRELTQYFMNRLLLPEMGEPRASAVEFYTNYLDEEKKKDVFWTPDYKINGQTSVKNPRIVFKESELTIRGRKFYWHHEEWKSHVHNTFNKNRDNKDMVCWVQPILANNQIYEFDIYVERLTLNELKEILWAIDFDDEKCAHKIGRGKPLGFGSVQLQIEKIQKRKINLSTGEWELEEYFADRQLYDEVNSVMKSLRTISNWVNKPDNKVVSYPLGEDRAKMKEDKANSTASHQWFRGNQSNGVFKKVLPTIEEEINKEKNSNPENRWLYKMKK